MTTTLLKPGNYSIFVLFEDNTYTQKTFKIDQPMTEHEFKINAETRLGGFISFGVDDDCDCDPCLLESFDGGCPAHLK